MEPPSPSLVASHKVTLPHRPCSNCLKKSRADLCLYTPKPGKNRPPKSMAARLRRLEGMVREMIDEEGNVKTQQQQQQPVHRGADEGAASGDAVAAAAAAVNYPSTTAGQVVQANGARGRSTTYVGATHFLAMLDDVRIAHCPVAALDSTLA